MAWWCSVMPSINARRVASLPKGCGFGGLWPASRVEESYAASSPSWTERAICNEDIRPECWREGECVPCRSFVLPVALDGQAVLVEWDAKSTRQKCRELAIRNESRGDLWSGEDIRSGWLTGGKRWTRTVQNACLLVVLDNFASCCSSETPSLWWFERDPKGSTKYTVWVVRAWLRRQDIARGGLSKTPSWGRGHRQQCVDYGHWAGVVFF